MIDDDDLELLRAAVARLHGLRSEQVAVTFELGHGRRAHVVAVVLDDEGVREQAYTSSACADDAEAFREVVGLFHAYVAQVELAATEAHHTVDHLLARLRESDPPKAAARRAPRPPTRLPTKHLRIVPPPADGKD